MLCRTISRAAAAAPRSGVRALSSTAMQQSNTPGMGDINPSSSSVESFNQKQKAFRERLVEAQKERDARALAQKNASNLSAAKGEDAAANLDAGLTAEKLEPEPTQKSGPLTNLIYGTKEGREMEAQLEASFSQVLARGKYMHSIVFHEVKPDKVDEYVQLVSQWYPKMANLPENKVHLVGSWRTEVGDCDTFGKCSSLDLQRPQLTTLQSTSGSTRSTRATTSPATRYPTTPDSPSSSASLRPSSTPRRST